MKKRGLGRGLNDLGLDELLSSVTTPADIDSDEMRRLPVEFLAPGKYQPRKVIVQDQLQELADSIKAQGIIQPILARRVENNRYEIIAGERRWRAAQLAGLSEVPVIVRDIPDESAIAMALIENIQREDLNAIEEAEAMNRLINEYKLTHQELASIVGKSRTTITNLLRLLGLHPDVRTMVERGDLEMGHARALLALAETDQVSVAKQVVSKGLSVRDTERLIQNFQNPTQKQTKSTPSADITHLQRQLSDRLGAATSIQHLNSGKGKLVIKYNTVDELEGILAIIGVEKE